MPSGVPSNSEAARARAEAFFKRRQEQAADAPVAWTEYKDAQEAFRERTRALRELRLARKARREDEPGAKPKSGGGT
jgi:hypothetical protein